MATYYDLVNRKQIKQTIRITNKFGDKHHWTYGKSVDEAVEIWKNRAEKSNNIINILQAYRDNSDLLTSQEDLDIVNALISHPENDRLRLIHDGSYYTHRIWAYVSLENKIKFIIEIDWETQRYYPEFAKAYKQLNEFESVTDKVNYLFELFEVVYIQFLVDTCDREPIEQAIQFEVMDRKADIYEPDFIRSGPDE